MIGYSRRFRQRLDAVRGHCRHDSRIPPGAPLVDRPRGNSSQNFRQFRARTSGVDCLRYRIVFGVHEAKCGTDSSACQPTESSDVSGHPFGMDTKKRFAIRLATALDHAGVSTRPIERKRYLSQSSAVSERHAGNYLSGDKMPTTEGLIELAIKLGVDWTWLATGQGCMVPANLTEAESATLGALSSADRERLFQIGAVLGRARPDSNAA